MSKENTDKRILLLRATEKLLAQEGFHGLSMQKVDRMFEQGKEQGLFKPLDNQLLSAVSLESSATLARKKLLSTRCL